MRIRLPNIIELTIALSVVAPLAHGEEITVSQEAHVHGLSELSIAMEGEKLEIQFTSPAMNLLGFEHKASTQKDLVAIENTASVLRQHKTLFLFSGSRCDHINTSIDLTVLIESDEHKKEHEKHEEHAQNNNHSDVVASYKYRCENIGQLRALTVDVFEAFPGVHKVNAGWIKPIQQGAATLTPSHRVVEFR
ncbi:MAG: DUF2796 domain-containing protein [Gammaproteobacteria bacterium]|nr:DUF2796 domain-containing protein [Gammaproteobacteria bacterium]